MIALCCLNLKKLRHSLAGPLPGKAAHIKMAPHPEKGQINRWIKPDDRREAAVLILLYGKQKPLTTAHLYLALMQRNQYSGAHSGQVSLPGGECEPGEPPEQTALRETREELGIVPESLQMLGRLSGLYVSVSNFYIYPYVAFSAAYPDFQIDPREVAKLIETPLSLLLDPANCKQERWHLKRYGLSQVPFFDVFGHKVWGATAMILSEFLTLLRNE